MTGCFLPDINFWVALSREQHPLHPRAERFFESLGDRRTAFCRYTALGHLRLLMNRHVTQGQPYSFAQAVQAQMRIREAACVVFVPEPDEAESIFLAAAQSEPPPTKDPSDLYLAAFGCAAGMPVVTFDLSFPVLPGLEVVTLRAD